MTDEEIKRLFAGQVDQILTQIYEQDEKLALSAREYLERLRAEIAKEIEDGEASEFTLSRLRQVQAAIDTRIAEFEGKLTNGLQQAVSRSFELGIKLIDEPLAAAGLSGSVIGINRALAQVVAGYSADLIKGLTNDIRDSINGILGRVALSGITFKQALDQVGSSLDSPGVFKSFAERAEAIVRTEVLRIQAIATQARMEAHKEQVRKAGWDLIKAWLTSNDERVRKAHEEAEGQERDVDKPYDVGGELLMFPRDPKGSAKNTILCRCVSIPVIKKLAA